MKKLLFILSLICINSHATSLVNCTGQFVDGKSYHILFNAKTNTVIVNNDIRKIELTRTVDKGKNYIVFTDNYVNQYGEYVYLRFYFIPPYSGSIASFNAATEKKLSESSMTCYRED